VTAYDQPALGGVYKLSAVRNPGGNWQHKIKLSEQVAKVSTPGLQQVRRFYRDGAFLGDMIYDLDGPNETSRVIVDRTDMTRRKHIPEDADHEDLLVPIFRNGRLVYNQPPITTTRQRAQTQLAGLHEGHKRFLNPHEYPVGLSATLHDLRTQLILAARGIPEVTKATDQP
jgi:nicotinate phosphoribosyltransferase